MQNIFDITLTGRRTLEAITAQFSTDQLNKIPEGFANNLIWNLGHIIVVQQMLVYKLSGLPMMIPDEMVERYKRGTRPEAVTDDGIAKIKALLFTTIHQTKIDLESGKFVQYQEFTTMSGYTIRSAQDAIAFNIYHEGVHTGIMMQIRKSV